MSGVMQVRRSTVPAVFYDAGVELVPGSRTALGTGPTEFRPIHPLAAYDMPPLIQTASAGPRGVRFDRRCRVQSSLRSSLIAIGVGKRATTR